MSNRQRYSLRGRQLEPTVWVAIIDEASDIDTITYRRTKGEIITAVEEWIKKDGREWVSDSEGRWENYRWDDGLYDVINIREVSL